MTHASESGHWYDRQGNSVWEVVGANGQMVTPDIRHARKLGLLPGATSVLKCQDKPQLTKWLIDQGILAALTLPRVDGESNEALLYRIREDAQEQGRKAADRGVAIHASIQGHLEGEPPETEFWPFVKAAAEKLRERFGDQAWIAEKSFACPRGYGGKVDVHCRSAVGDIKTKEFTSADLSRKKPKQLTWDEHAQQLAAYRRGLQLPGVPCFNLFVSTNEPGLVHLHEWAEDELARALAMFDGLLAYWQAKSNYNSAFEPLKEAA